MSDEPQETPDPAAGAAEEPAASPDEQEKRIDRIERKLDELLSGGSGGGKPDGKSGDDIARLVREGVDKIEADKKAKADADQAAADDKAWRESVEKKLEQKPGEPTGRVRGFAQRWGLGIRG